MKKFLALILSVVMLVSVTAGVDFSASAEQAMTTLTFGSEIEGATEEDVFLYEILVDGEDYEAIAYDSIGEEHEFQGTIEIPATEYYMVDIPYNSSYVVYRYQYDKEDYLPVEEDYIEGFANEYNYFEEYSIGEMPFFDELTEQEYNEKTNNGANTSQVFYYDSKADKRYAPSEVVEKTVYSESLSSEEKHEIGYFNGDENEYPVELIIDATYNAGVLTNYYTGTIYFTVGNNSYEQNFATVPSRDVTTSKERAITSIATYVRGFAAAATTNIIGENKTSLYFADSLDEMLPKAKDMSTKADSVRIVDKTSKAIEVEALEKLDINYSKELDIEGEEAILYGELVVVHDHDFVELYTSEPTCSEEGYTYYVCKICSADKKDDFVEIDANAHSFTNYVTNNDAVSPTCTVDGITASKTAKCDRCDAIDTIDGTVRTATGHVARRAVEENRKEPTCAKKGSYDSVVYCLICNEELSRDKVSIPKLEHNYNAGKVTTEATCAKAGVKTYTCKDCGYKKTETIKATGKHSFNSGKVTKKPTSSEAGTMTYTCKTCGYKKTETIQKLAKASISKLSPLSKGFKATWKKVSSATGYQIQYSTSNKFTSPKAVTVSKNSTVSKSVTKLKANKKYYVRIRTYRTINGTKYYSSWSSYKIVTTKK